MIQAVQGLVVALHELGKHRQTEAEILDEVDAAYRQTAMARVLKLFDLIAITQARATLYTSKTPHVLEALTTWAGSHNLQINVRRHPPHKAYGAGFAVHSVSTDGIRQDIEVYEDGRGFGVEL